MYVVCSCLNVLPRHPPPTNSPSSFQLRTTCAHLRSGDRVSEMQVCWFLGCSGVWGRLGPHVALFTVCSGLAPLALCLADTAGAAGFPDSQDPHCSRSFSSHAPPPSPWLEKERCDSVPQWQPRWEWHIIPIKGRLSNTNGRLPVSLLLDSEGRWKSRF